MQEIKPDSSHQLIESVDTVFLAGSIEMGAAEDWQVKAANYLADIDCTVFNPRRDDWDSSWIQRESNSQFNYQVNWELDKLSRAKHIFMYFSPETKSPISLLELGLFAESGKLIVCCPDGFWRKGNVEIVCTRYGIPLYNDLNSAFGALRTMLLWKQ